MRLFGLPSLLLALLAIGSCDPGILTQVIIHYRSDYLGETATLVRITSIREGLDDIVVERSMLGPSPQAAFPLQVPIEPTGGDSARRFRVVAEFLDEGGVTLHRRETIGGFVDGRRLEVVVRLDRDCDASPECGPGQTCVMGACQAACVLPVEQEGRDETPSISCAAFRKRIRLVDFNVRTEVEDLPILVSLTDPDLAREARDDGGDIAFADVTGVLPHELVYYDPEDGSLIAWVRVPVIRSNADTEFFMYFHGASTPVDDGVWSGFEAVWHLDEEDGFALDQAPLGNTLTSMPRASVSGVVHRAQEFRGIHDDDPDDIEARKYVFRGGSSIEGFDFSSEDSISISVWANIRDLESGSRLIYGGASGVPGFLLSTARADLRDAEGVRVLVGPREDIAEDEWTLITLVVDRGEPNRASLYRNGEQDAAWDMPDIGDLGAPSADPPFIALGGSGGCCFINGFLDEVWVQRQAWSQARIRAMFHNQRDPPASIRVDDLEALH